MLLTAPGEFFRRRDALELEVKVDEVLDCERWPFADVCVDCGRAPSNTIEKVGQRVQVVRRERHRAVRSTQRALEAQGEGAAGQAPPPKQVGVDPGPGFRL